jgi:hypothetical protein
MVIGSAPAVLLRRPRRPPPCLPLPLPAAGPRPLPTMLWPARCVLASTVLHRCCCAMAATRGSTCSALACAGSARPLTGTAQLVLDPLLAIRLPLLATLAAARGPMALALRHGGHTPKVRPATAGGLNVLGAPRHVPEAQAEAEDVCPSPAPAPAPCDRCRHLYYTRLLRRTTIPPKRCRRSRCTSRRRRPAAVCI